MDALGTDLLLTCSSSLPAEQLHDLFGSVIKNLRTIGIAGSEWSPHPKRIAFEALSWGTIINLWSQAWEIVQAVDLENVGICLDSFNTLAREWADPTLEGGIQPNATKNLKKSMKRLSTEVVGQKIFLLQIGDGARLKEPIEKGTVERPALMTWSRSSRLFPMEFDLGAYLPVKDFILAVLRAGYEGYWSVEVFNDSLKSTSDSTPLLHAMRAFEGLLKLDHCIYSDDVQDNPHHYPRHLPAPLEQLNSQLHLPSHQMATFTEIE